MVATPADTGTGDSRAATEIGVQNDVARVDTGTDSPDAGTTTVDVPADRPILDSNPPPDVIAMDVRADTALAMDGGMVVDVVSVIDGGSVIDAPTTDTMTVTDAATATDASTVADGGSTDVSAPDGGTVTFDGGATSCVPPCLMDLIAGCTPMGTCMYEMSSSPPYEQRQCYGNGVRIVATFDASLMNGTAVYSHSGTVCMTAEFTTSPGGASSGTYRDPSGRAVATYSQSGMGSIFTVSCGGTNYIVDNSSPGCMAFSGMAGPCTMGRCP